MKSDSDAQKIRPPILNSDNRPAKPAATAATATFCSALSALKVTSGAPISEPAKISCSIGDAIPITPMPAETFRHSTHQTNQNCGVLCASFKCTWCCVIIALALLGGVQPSGCQPTGGRR